MSKAKGKHTDRYFDETVRIEIRISENASSSEKRLLEYVRHLANSGVPNSRIRILLLQWILTGFEQDAGKFVRRGHLAPATNMEVLQIVPTQAQVSTDVVQVPPLEQTGTQTQMQMKTKMQAQEQTSSSQSQVNVQVLEQPKASVVIPNSPSTQPETVKLDKPQDGVDISGFLS